ncbi:MAG TPA: hypothetical protein VFG53_10065 [Anaeromyxobacter sp.]|nr:hypothetical protein [Anaeromyxobacter sp.]
MPTDLPPLALHQIFRLLVYWIGRPLHAVLSAGGPVGWFEIWGDVLTGVPDRPVTVEFETAEAQNDEG